jgi:hypothetical protein
LAEHLAAEVTLQNFYKNNVIGGTDSFHLHAASFSDFNDAVKKKIFLEVDGGGSGDVAEPATLGLLGLSLLGFAFIRRRA